MLLKHSTWKSHGPQTSPTMRELSKCGSSPYHSSFTWPQLKQSRRLMNLAALSRLYWWKAVLENIGRNQPPEHPVAMAVCEAVEVYDLDVQLLQSLVHHRIEELKVTQPATEKEVFQYAEVSYTSVAAACRHTFPLVPSRSAPLLISSVRDQGTQSPMLHLTLQAIGEYKREGNQLAAKHVGIAMGICLLLRGTRHNAKRQSSPAPLSIPIFRSCAQTHLMAVDPTCNDDSISTLCALHRPGTKFGCPRTCQATSSYRQGRWRRGNRPKRWQRVRTRWLCLPRSTLNWFCSRP